MLEKIRAQWTKVIRPLALGLLKLGITPDIVTWTGTIGAILVAVICFPQGWLWQGTLVMLVFIFSDSLDGTMARESGRSSKWGAFLDSTLDRLADGAILGGLALYYASRPDGLIWCGLAIAALVFALVTSYSKARGESVGIEVHAGLAGRADRLVLSLVGAFATGLGVSWALPVALIYLCAAGAFTVGQRMWIVRKAIVAEQATRPDADEKA